MTIASENQKKLYSGNGSTTVFAYDFKINDDDHLEVVIADASDTQHTLTKTTHYTVSGVGEDSGGNVTLGNLTAICGSSALPSGWSLSINRAPPFTQLTDFENQGGFFPETHEDAIDYLTQMCLYLKEQLVRAVKVTITSGDTGDAIGAAFEAQMQASIDAGVSAAAAQVAAEHAQGDAEAAQALAESARDTAISAKDAAVIAQGLAEHAQSDAEAAQSAAEAAQGLAETAQGLAEAAQSSAESARDTATGAASSASISAGAASADAGTASSAKDDAVIAKNAAEAAQGLAEHAQSDAEAAQGLAESARDDAQTAQGLAEGARDAAIAARDAVVVSLHTETATTSQTAINISGSFSALDTDKNNIQVYIDGVRQATASWTRTSNTVLTLDAALAGGELIEVYSASPSGTGGAPAATETVAGVAELATTAEAQALTDTSRIVTPAGLAAVTATESRTGIAELATTAEAKALTDTSRILVPARLKEVLDDHQWCFKNLIIGGDFATNPWQRGTTFTAPATGVYTADRFFTTFSTEAVFDVLKTADAPTAAEAGAYTTSCFHVDVTTADAAIGAAQFCDIVHRLEGNVVQSLGFGQSGTRYCTLSFWVKSTKTGTFCVMFCNSAANRRYIAEYTVTSSDTWEKKTITIPVDTTGTWLYTTGIGLQMFWMLACGSDNHATGATWGTSGFSTSNQVNALDNTANNFKLALVQLEAGAVATAFEARPYAVELGLCKRYFRKSFNQAVAPAQNTGDTSGLITCSPTRTNEQAINGGVWVPFDAPMRTTPAFTFYNPSYANANWKNLGAGADAGFGAIAVYHGEACAQLVLNSTSVTDGGNYGIHYTATAEL